LPKGDTSRRAYLKCARQDLGVRFGSEKVKSVRTKESDQGQYGGGGETFQKEERGRWNEEKLRETQTNSQRSSGKKPTSGPFSVPPGPGEKLLGRKRPHSSDQPSLQRVDQENLREPGFGRQRPCSTEGARPRYSHSGEVAEKVPSRRTKTSIWRGRLIREAPPPSKSGLAIVLMKPEPSHKIRTFREAAT